MNSFGRTDWAKIADVPDIAFTKKAFRDFFQRLTTCKSAAIGHNRAKTFGANTTNNAHPFEIENILGVHNGTIKNKHALCTNGSKYDVDSQAFIAGIAENGIDATVKASDGAFSVVYFNKTDKTINFIRNKERPMWMVEGELPAYTPQGIKRSCIFFGSELLMVKWIATRHGFHIINQYETVPMELISFNLDTAGIEKRVLEEYTAPVYVYPESREYTSGSAWDYKGRMLREDIDAIDNEYDDTVMSSKFAKVGTITKKPDEPKSNVIVLPNSSSEETPFELKGSTFLANKDIDGSTKRHFIRRWREAHIGDSINFQVKDMTPLNDSQSAWQCTGILAGKKNANLPITVTAIIPNDIVMQADAQTVFSGEMRIKQIMDNNRSYVFIVQDAEIIANAKTKGVVIC